MILIYYSFITLLKHHHIILITTHNRIETLVSEKKIFFSQKRDWNFQRYFKHTPQLKVI